MLSLPIDEFSRDQVTPYRLSLLILIKEYADIFDGKNKEFPRMAWQDEWVGKRHLDRALLSWIQQPDGSLKDILRTVGFCSKVLYSGFTSMLDAICNFESIENLENFFTNLGYTLFEETDSLLHKRGLLGLFCRRMLVYHDRLAFCEIQPFFEKFIKYCSPYIAVKQDNPSPTLKKSSGNTGANNIIISVTDEKEVEDDMELESQSEMDSKSSRDSTDVDLKPSDLKSKKHETFEASEYFTRQQAEYFLSEQVALIEMKDSDALPPGNLQTKIRQVLRNNPEVAQAHYVSYLNNLRVKEFCGAMDSLFMYFIRHHKNVSPLSLKKFEDEKISRTQRFATLNLALLHLRFGHKKAALACVKESIKLSQLSNDSICLQQAMSLLNHLQPKASFHKIAEEIILPAKKQNLTDLAFLAVQAHTNQLSASSEKPSHVFRNLAAADALQCTRPFSCFSSTGFAHKASLWRMYGKRHMALLYCQLALSMQSAMDKKSYMFSSRYNSEDVALSLSHLAELLHEEGMNNACSDLLNHAKIRFPSNSRHSHYWRQSEARLNHQSSLRLYKHCEANHTEPSFSSLSAVEALLQKAEILASCNENLKAHSMLVEILRTTDHDEITPEIKCKVNILIGNLLSRNICERAASFKYLLKAFSIARTCYLENLAVEALLKLAQLQIYSNSASLGYSCIKSVFLECLSNGSVHARSSLFLITVRCKMRCKASQSLKEIEELIELLLRAQEGFEKFQDLARKRDAVYLLAKLYNEKSLASNKDLKEGTKIQQECIQQRNVFASEFKRLDIQLGSKKRPTLM